MLCCSFARRASALARLLGTYSHRWMMSRCELRHSLPREYVMFNIISTYYLPARLHQASPQLQAEGGSLDLIDACSLPPRTSNAPTCAAKVPPPRAPTVHARRKREGAPELWHLNETTVNHVLLSRPLQLARAGRALIRAAVSLGPAHHARYLVERHTTAASEASENFGRARRVSLPAGWGRGR